MNPKSGFKYIDIHSHLNFAAFDADRDEAIKRALDAGVALITVGTQRDTSKKAVEMAEQYEKGVYAIIGLHPVHTSKSFHDEKELGEGGKEFTSRGESYDAAYYEQLARHPKVVGIGECGLDYYRENEDAGFKIQEQAFRNQIELAIGAKKPLMLHIRNGSGRSAYLDAYHILKSYFIHHESPVRANLHFFAGTAEEAKPFLDAGYTFSFTGVITFTRDYHRVIEYLPLDRILSETDAPYVTPTPHRGKRNEPLYVQEVVRRIAEIKKVPLEAVQEAIIQNAERLFGISLA